jgi:hypothetical protein
MPPEPALIRRTHMPMCGRLAGWWSVVVWLDHGIPTRLARVETGGSHGGWERGGRSGPGG